MYPNYYQKNNKNQKEEAEALRRKFGDVCLEENRCYYEQLCNFPVSELSDEEKNFVKYGNVRFRKSNAVMRSYRSIQQLVDKPTFILGDIYFTLVMSANDMYEPYCDKGILAFMLSEDFEYIKYYHVYARTDRRKKYFNMVAYPTAAYKEKCKSGKASMLRVVLAEKGHPVKWNEDVHHVEDTHDNINYKIIDCGQHRIEHCKEKNKWHNYNKKEFLYLLKDYAGFTDEEFEVYIRNLSIIRELFSYYNAVKIHVDLTEDISHMTVNELFGYLELY